MLSAEPYFYFGSKIQSGVSIFDLWNLMEITMEIMDNLSCIGRDNGGNEKTRAKSERKAEA